MATQSEQAGQKEQQMHEVDVLERTEQVEAEPARAIDDGVCAPTKRRLVERERRGGLRAQIGDEGMERHHHHDGVAAQVAQCQARSGHVTNAPGDQLALSDRAFAVARHSPIGAIML